VADAAGGKFKVTGSAVEDMHYIKPDKLSLLRRKMWEANQAGVEMTVISDHLDRLSVSLPSFKRRTDDLLELIISRADPLTA
jgi:hypothetical protein